MPESNEYSYMPPEDVAPLDDRIFNPANTTSEVWQEPLSRDEYNRQWVERKRQYHLDNLAGLNGIWHGTMYINGVGQPRG